MIAFGCSITSPEVYERCAQPGIELAREPDSKLFVYQASGSIYRSYNLILDKAGACEDLDALVLLHQDAEILDPDFCQQLRCALRDPDVGVVGCVGASGARSIAWWEGTTISGSFLHRYDELGGGEFLAFSPNGGEPSRDRSAIHEVDTVDGFMMALSPWTVRNVRFDESLGPHWGYDFDLCLQVRSANRKVATAALKVAHNRPLALVGSQDRWMAAHMRAAEKWEGRLAPGESNVDWKLRARRAEAEAVVARLQCAASLLLADARSAEHARRMARITDTVSWRMTHPLRRANALRKARRQPRP